MSSEALKTIFPQSSVLKPRSDLKMYTKQENSKKTQGKCSLKNFEKPNSKLKCESWLNLFNEELDTENAESIPRSDSMPIDKENEGIVTSMGHKNKSSIVISKRQPILHDSTNKITKSIEKSREIDQHQKRKISKENYGAYDDIDSNSDEDLVFSQESNFNN